MTISKDEYDMGIMNPVLKMQLAKDLNGVTKEQMANVVIAYEPVWAIGTGLVCGAEDASKLLFCTRFLLVCPFTFSYAVMASFVLDKSHFSS